MRITLGDYVLDVGVERTRNTYRKIERGGAESCGCCYCRNYLAVSPDALPKEMVRFLSEAGVDIRKDAEVYEMGEVSPGIRAYGGEYYLWGSVVSEPKKEQVLENDFRFAFTGPGPLAQDEFRSEGAVCLHFSGNLPWVLSYEDA